MKKLLLSLFVWLFSLIWFWYCDTVENLIDYVDNWDFSINSNSTSVIYNLGYNDYWVYCLDVNNYDAWWHLYNYISFWCNNINNQIPENRLNVYWDQVPAIVCLKCNQPYLTITNTYDYDISFWYNLYNLDTLLETELPVMSLSECQSEYNLIPIESVDTNYCVENELCPVNECIWSWFWSNVYINDILHPWEENIFVNIPDYIQWDYSISSWDFNIYVWSWYDMDYMNSIIKINSYRPDSTDFTNIFVSGLTLIFPYIFVLLLIIFIWKLIKRIFK